MTNAGVASYFSALVFCVTTVVILLSYYVSSQLKKKKLAGHDDGKSSAHVPPGSLGLAWLGESLDFLKHHTRNTLVSYFRSKKAKHGGTFTINVLGSPAVILDPPAGLKFLFSSEGTLLEHSWPSYTKLLFGADSMTLKDAEPYRRARRHATNFLNPSAVAKHLPMIQKTARRHFATTWQPPPGSADDSEFELLARDVIKKNTLELVAGLCLSLTSGPDLEYLFRNMNHWVKGLFCLPINLPGFQYHRALKGRAKVISLFEKLKAKRRRAQVEGRATDDTQDVLSFLLTQPDERGRKNTDGEVDDNLLLFIFAGYDTAACVLTMAIIFIAKNPTVYERLRKEHEEIASRKEDEEGYRITKEDLRAMTYTWAVLRETMRLVPPGAGSFRGVVKDFEYNGYTIPKGWQVYWTTQSTHENPEFFVNPTKFDPSRWEAGGSASNLPPYVYLPFGGGQRLCPGQEFARMEMLVFIHYLVRNYKWTLSEPDAPLIRCPVPEQVNGTPIKVRKVQKTLPKVT